MNYKVMNYRCFSLSIARGLLATSATVVLVLVGSCLASPAALALDVAGTVKTSQGNVHILRDGKSIPAVVGAKVMAGDVLRTSSESSAGVTLKDDTRVSLVPNSQVVLDKFAFNANTHEGGMFLSVLKGTLSMISGLLVRANPELVRVKTPTATIGIRGTEFIVDVP